MALYPSVIQLPPHTRSDKWLAGIHFGPVLIDGDPPEYPIASARLQFRDPRTDALGYELTTAPAVGQGVITIEDAAAWELDIPKQDLPLPSGLWLWDLEVTNTAGEPLTPYGGTIKVGKDISHD